MQSGNTRIISDGDDIDAGQLKAFDGHQTSRPGAFDYHAYILHVSSSQVVAHVDADRLGSRGRSLLGIVKAHHAARRPENLLARAVAHVEQRVVASAFHMNNGQVFVLHLRHFGIRRAADQSVEVSFSNLPGPTVELVDVDAQRCLNVLRTEVHFTDGSITNIGMRAFVLDR